MKIRQWLLSALLVLSAGLPVHAGDMMWQQKFKKNVIYKKLTSSGIYLVMTENILYGLHPKTGMKAWSIPHDGLQAGDLEYVEGSPLLFIARGEGFSNQTVNMFAINIMDGKENWAIKDISGLLVGSQLVFEHGLVLLFTMGGKDGIAIHAYDMFNGSHKYKVSFPENQAMRSVQLKKTAGAGKFSTRLKLIGHQQPILDGDHLIIYYDYLRKIDLTTGRQIWMDQNAGRPGPKDTPLPRHGYAQMQLQDGILYTPYNEGVAAFDAATGQIKWKTEQMVGERVSEMVMDEDNLLVRSGGYTKGTGVRAEYVYPAFYYISSTEGSLLWKEPHHARSRTTNPQFIDDQIYLADSDRLYIINKADGTSETRRAALDFKDDSPYRLVNRKDGLLVQGLRTVVLYDIDGQEPVEKWRHYYKAPDSKSPPNKKSSIEPFNISHFITLNRIWTLPSAQVWNDFKKAISRRYDTTMPAHQYMLTKLDGGAGLIGVNLKTGEADREVLFKEKKPDYEIDELNGVAFFLKKKELKVFKLEGKRRDQ